MKKIKWPKQENLDSVLAELEATDGNLHLNKNASPLDQFRWELCQQILKYMRVNNLKQKELAKKLGLDEPEMSRILRHRIEKVSTDKLAKIIQKLDPGIKLRVG